MKRGNAGKDEKREAALAANLLLSLLICYWYMPKLLLQLWKVPRLGRTRKERLLSEKVGGRQKTRVRVLLRRRRGVCSPGVLQLVNPRNSVFLLY
jgi:hypothetical protein